MAGCNHVGEDVCAKCVRLNDPPYVNKFSPHAAFKHAILRKFAGMFNLKTFVETGTNKGDTVDSLKDCFTEIHSIELHPDLYQYATSRFANHEYIHIVHGNSGKILGSVLDRVLQPCLLWVDSHATGGICADEGLPLPEELRTIYEKCQSSLTVIDDQWPEDCDKLVVPDGWTKRWYHGLIFLHRGQYNIPERF